jgi:signal transduction histidine kinase
MKFRYWLIFVLSVSALGICAVLFLFPVPESAVDVSKINDIIQSGQVVDKTVFADTLTRWQAYRAQLQIGLVLILVVMAIGTLSFSFFLYHKILRPFQTMRSFAGRVAAGELDLPLAIDKRNAFGAYTESFDLMRDELKRAREAELSAERAKRELVTSLSHDILTPVASIKAVAELMAVTAGERESGKLRTILQKTEQLHALVTDLFHTTLEELHALAVNPEPFPSDQLAELIRKSDYQNKARIEEIPDCLLRVDPVRFAQVMDNMFANSYKYADTALEITVQTDKDELTLTLRDYGQGADPEELPLLCSQYYRGKNADGKSGYGLGLYISRTFMERMGGRLECFNAEPGFAVRLRLKFDG